MECIALKQITFIYIGKMNVPFDPVLDFIPKFNEDYASLIAFVKSHYPTQFKTFKEKLPKDSWQKYKDELLKITNEVLTNLFIFSTCEVNDKKNPCDNLYMWAYYANGHRGVAIEFDYH